MTKELDCLIAKLAQETTIPELLQIISALNFQLQQKQEKEIQKAKQAFINAYTEYRMLDPYESCYVDIYDDNGEFYSQEDLLKLMDEKFLRGE